MGLTDEDINAYLLDPDIMLPVIQKKVHENR